MMDDDPALMCFFLRVQIPWSRELLVVTMLRTMNMTYYRKKSHADCAQRVQSQLLSTSCMFDFP